MCMVDYDADLWTLLGSGEHTARKTHRCDDCGRDVMPGERYRYITGISDGHFEVFKMCTHCTVAAGWLSKVCSGYLWGGVIDDLSEHVDGDESEFRTHALAKLRDWARAKWAPNADLIQVVDVERLTEMAINAHLRRFPLAVS